MAFSSFQFYDGFLASGLLWDSVAHDRPWPPIENTISARPTTDQKVPRLRKILQGADHARGPLHQRLLMLPEVRFHASVALGAGARR